MPKPLIRSPRSIAEQKNRSEGFHGTEPFENDRFDWEAGAPASAGMGRNGERDVAANPINPSPPAKEWATK